MIGLEPSNAVLSWDSSIMLSNRGYALGAGAAVMTDAKQPVSAPPQNVLTSTEKEIRTVGSWLDRMGGRGSDKSSNQDGRTSLLVRGSGRMRKVRPVTTS